MEIAIKNLQKTIPLNPAHISKIAKKALDFLGITDAGLSLVFTTDFKIRSLNRKYLKRAYATDVLAFDLKWREPPKRADAMTGEIIISTQTVLKNARRYGVLPAQELKLCIIHGILHLAGYDDHKPRDIKRMRRKEQEILACLSR